MTQFTFSCKERHSEKNVIERLSQADNDMKEKEFNRDNVATVKLNIAPHQTSTLANTSPRPTQS